MNSENLIYWGLGLYAVSVFLVIVEIFLPSGGVIGLLAAVVAIAGDVCLWMVDATWGVIGLLLILVGGPVCFFIGVNMLPNTPVGHKLLYGEEGKPPDLDAPPPENPLKHLVGKEGVVVTDLRPIGVARIDGQRHDVLAETSLVQAGTKVRVISVRGTEIKVRPIGPARSS